MSLQARLKRVLSIQSHVVHGYVGNKSATFPLQLLGFEVDAINSVQFSNHTGYGVVKGQVLNEQQLAELFEGLEGNSLLPLYSHLLTGYIGNPLFLRQTMQIVKKLRETNPNLIYVCDPVMGDNGAMYVPKELLPIYRDEIVPLADVVTPNQYEMELLTEAKIENDADVWKAVQWFHDRGVGTVAVSSSEIGRPGDLRAFLSNKSGARYTLNIPKQGDGISFTGTGDLFASLMLAHSYEMEDMNEAFENTIATLQSVIRKTLQTLPQEVREGKRQSSAQERELKLIQCKNEIEKPQVLLKAERVQN